MAFDHIDYVSHHPSPPAQSWAATFSWLNLVLVSPTEMRVTNLDGTVTVFHGSGFSINALGEPNAGSVTRIERLDAGRSEVWESIDFRDELDPGSVSIGSFIVNGFDSWISQGSDDYSISPGVVINELPGAGVDSITLSAAPADFYVVAPNVENLKYTGSSVLRVRANDEANHIRTGSGADTISGLGGDDFLDGGAGNDQMIGGLGNDTYVVDHVGDRTVETAGQGNDTVHTTLGTYKIGLNIENVKYIGGGTAILTGNELNNVIGGGAGADTLAGGLGNDTYIADSSDTIVENLNQGIDTVKTVQAAFTLGANIENLVFFRPDPDVPAIDHTGTGNGLANKLVGDNATDTLYGLAGDDALDGGEDDVADVLHGGLGNDVYILNSPGGVADTVVEAAGEGIDTVHSFLSSYTLAANVENLTLQGTVYIGLQVGIGNNLDNTIIGTLSPDRLDGGAGNDTLKGGHSHDTYVIDSLNDIIFEIQNQGADTVETALASYTLGLNLENIRFTNGAISHTGTGNAVANHLTGASGADTLNGMAGDDLLDGGLGADTLVGGGGNDTFVVDQAGDVVTELAAQGTDAVKTKLAAYTLGANVENLSFARAEKDLTPAIAHTGTGNALANALKGDAEADTLYGLAGSDTLDGGEVYDDNINKFLRDGKADSLYGGAGNDVYVVRDSTDLAIENANEGIDLVISHADTFTLGANVENIDIVGLRGTKVTATGNALANKMKGGDSNDKLDGGAGNDNMTGGDGNDIYVVDSLGDVVLELAGQGTDTVDTTLANYTLAASLENLTFTGGGTRIGRGNELDNVLIGSNGFDTLYGGLGGDTLAGGLDAVSDKLYGGAGNDTYILLDTLDQIFEGASEGTRDTVVTSLSGYTLKAGLEDFHADVHAGVQIATGNASANQMLGNSGKHNSGSEVFHGLGGDDHLDSGHRFDKNSLKLDDLLADTMHGGTGNDTYVVWSNLDSVVEAAGEGIDTVLSYAFATTLAANVENLSIVGRVSKDFVSAIGNGLNNVITGGISQDTINGGAGNDIMAGGGGNDTYVVDSLLDVVTETLGAGSDTVLTNLAKYTLGANVDNVVGTASVAQALTGNELNNSLTGGDGTDTLKGLTGHDTYYVSAGDNVVELADQGIDVVKTAMTSYTLTSNVENLAYYNNVPMQADSDFTGTGNGLANTITGGKAHDSLYGLTGNDRLEGGNGDDRLVGGGGNDVLSGDALSADGKFIELLPDSIPGNVGNDTFYITAGHGRDEVIDFRGANAGGGDKLSIFGLATLDTYAEVQSAMTQTAAGVRIDLDVNTSIMLKGLDIADLGAGDFIFTAP